MARAPARAAPICRCPRTGCRCVAAAGGASAGGTWARTATSCCSAPRGSRSESSDRRFGRSGTASAARCGSGPACGSPARAARSGPRRRDGEGGLVNYAPDEGSLVRIEARLGDGEVRAFLRLGAGRWVESVCPNGEGEYVWTRKRADVPVECDVRVGERRWRVEARGMEDESAGYHPRHTVWSWSAGVGRTGDGRSVGWNLVSGINDPPQRSERAIWVDGEPFEPGPVELRGPGGDRLRRRVPARVQRRVRAAKAARTCLLVRYTYRQPFGSFSGTLPGGLELDARPRRHGAPRRSLVARAGARSTPGEVTGPSTAMKDPHSQEYRPISIGPTLPNRLPPWGSRSTGSVPRLPRAPCA